MRAFVYGLKHVGLEPMRQHEELLLEVALDREPGELFEAIQHLKGIVHPQDLDDAWERGMDKEDIAVDALPEGFHVTGFLNTVTGAKLKKVLDSVVRAPRQGRHPHRFRAPRPRPRRPTPTVLANGLPSDKGVKPHLSVFVDADTLEAAAEHVKAKPRTPTSPTPCPLLSRPRLPDTVPSAPTC